MNQPRHIKSAELLHIRQTFAQTNEETFRKATSRHCRLRNSTHGDKRSNTIRLGHRGSTQNTLLTNGRGRNTWFPWKPDISGIGLLLSEPRVTCRRYMTNIKPTSVQRLVFAGFELMSYMVSAAHLLQQTRDVELMLGWCLRRWANINPALAQRLVSHGFAPRWSHAHQSGYLT